MTTIIISVIYGVVFIVLCLILGFKFKQQKIDIDDWSNLSMELEKKMCNEKTWYDKKEKDFNKTIDQLKSINESLKFKIVELQKVIDSNVDTESKRDISDVVFEDDPVMKSNKKNKKCK